MLLNFHRIWKKLLLVLHSIAQQWSNFHCEDLRMVQFPLHALSTHAEGVQWKLQHLYQGGAMKLRHPQALAMEFAPWLGYKIKY